MHGDPSGVVHIKEVPLYSKEKLYAGKSTDPYKVHKQRMDAIRGNSA